LTCEALFPDTSPILHFHNHSIGLNPVYEDLVNTYAKSHHIILQIHDFVEDGRKSNLANISNWDKLYPSGSNIHYTVINSRDQNVLKQAGAQNLHLLPNCYRAVPRTKQKVAPIIFYPVQALRRENIGEILLLSLFTPPHYRYAIGLTPKSETLLNKFWEQIASQFELPIQFNVSNNILAPHVQCNKFTSWYSVASHIVTTSVQEGFGMAFIEPIHFQKPLFGRDLPDITTSIKAKGVNHKYLYTKLFIDTNLLKIISLIAQNNTLRSNCFVESGEKRLPLLTFVTNALNNTKIPIIECIKPWSQTALQKNLSLLYNKVYQSPICLEKQLDHKMIKLFFNNLPKLAIKDQPLCIPTQPKFF